MRAVVVAPGEGHAVGNVEFLARTTDTPRFNFALITIAPRRAGPEAHVHAAEDDAFFMLEGELTFTVDGEDVLAGPARSSSSRRGSLTRSPTRATSRHGSSTSTHRPASTSASKRTDPGPPVRSGGSYPPDRVRLSPTARPHVEGGLR